MVCRTDAKVVEPRTVASGALGNPACEWSSSGEGLRAMQTAYYKHSRNFVDVPDALWHCVGLNVLAVIVGER